MSELKPVRELGTVRASSIIIGQVIGSGIFVNIPIVAGLVDNIWMAVLIWLIGGLLWLPQILILAEMGTAYPEQGGPYYFIHKAGSPFLAFQYTWTAFTTSDTPTLTIIGLFAANALSFIWPEIFTDQIIARLFAVLLIILFTMIQFRGIKFGSSIQVGLTFAKLTPLIAVIVVGIFYLNSGNLSFYNIGETIKGEPISFGMILTGVAATVWAYAGFLNILYTSGEVKNPDKTLPRSMIGSVVFVLIAYVLICICTAAIVPFDQLTAVKEGDFINPFLYLGFSADYAVIIFAIAVFISMLGVMNSSALTQPRLEYAMAKDKLFFDVFGHLNKKYLTPDYSILIQSGLAIFFLLFGDIGDWLGYFTLSYLFQNMIVYGSIFFLPKRDDYKPAYRAPFKYVLAVISIIIQIVLIYFTFQAYGWKGALFSSGIILLGVPFYYYFYTLKKKTLSDNNTL